MKKKDLKILASKIVEMEKIIQENSDADEVARAKQAIIELSGRVTSVDEIFLLDELIQDLLGESK